jgi:hypothetical protein
MQIEKDSYDQRIEQMSSEIETLRAKLSQEQLLVDSTKKQHEQAMMNIESIAREGEVEKQEALSVATARLTTNEIELRQLQESEMKVRQELDEAQLSHGRILDALHQDHERERILFAQELEVAQRQVLEAEQLRELVERERDQIIESRKQFANRCSELETLINDGQALGHKPLPVSQPRGQSVEPGSSVSVAAGNFAPDAEAY